MGISDEIMKNMDMEIEGKEKKNETSEELEDSTEAAKIAKREIAKVAIKHLRTLYDEDDRLDVCSGMIGIFNRIGMFAGFGIEELFQNHLDSLEKAIESSEKGE